MPSSKKTYLNSTAKYLLTDSRLLIYPAETLFIAIKGERHDGHVFIKDLYQKGVRQFIIESKAISESLQKSISELPDVQVWEVGSSITALKQLAKHKREQFKIPVIGITGSNGKTIVKEWLAQLLAPDFEIVKSPKSYNSQIGVPLSVWQINNAHTLGIFEAGLSKPHEIEVLEKIIQPTFGIITNIGSAHDEGFRSRKSKVTEKLKLFSHCQKLVYCSDYEDIQNEVNIILKAVNPKCEFVSWGKNANTKWQILESGESIKIQNQATNQQTTLNIHQLSFHNAASLENLTHCIVTMLEFGIDAAEIQNRIDKLRPVSMRLEVKQGINNSYLIDDTYNNDLVGLTMALNFLSQQDQQPDKMLVLSDLLQTGQKESELYQQIADIIAKKRIKKLVAIGPAFQRNRSYFEENSTFYDTTQDFLNYFPTSSFSNVVALIKGARTFQFEKIVNHLEQKTHRTAFEINIDAITHNLNYYREKAGNDTKIMVMVKAFAYGSGSVEIAQLLQFHRVDYLAVAYTDEGVVLRNHGIELPIMVMNPSPESFDKMIEFKLEPEIYSPSIFKQFLEINNGKKVKIHLKLDTGMHRLGFVESDLDTLFETLSKHPEIEVASVFSHLVGADESFHNEFSVLQYQRFIESADKISKALNYQPIRHILNSAGIVRFPDFKLDMVRLGIGLYGVEVNNLEQHKLRNVGTLKTIISQVKHIKNGESVGYSRRGIVEKDTTIATIAIGYADGYDRRFGNGVGKVWVNGKLCPVVGNVCMDMTMIDISDTNATEGDEVIVFGEDLPITTLAHNIGTISYEILTGVSERVKRVFFKEES